MNETNEVKETEKPRRERGTGSIFRRGRIWWVSYYDASGQKRRESSDSPVEEVAKRMLRRRLGEKELGTLPTPRVNRLTYEKLRDALYQHFATNRKKLLRVGTGEEKKGQPYVVAVSPLDEFFKNYRALGITTERVSEFTKKRQEEGVSDGYINLSLSMLRRMFSLAVEDGRLQRSNVPFIRMLKATPPRKGFLEYDDFQRLRLALPEYLRPILTFGYYTGMRYGEIIGLKWSNVDLFAKEVTLDPGTTKNEEPRTIPLSGEVLEMLKIQAQKHPESEFVFTRNGDPIRDFRHAWVTATKKAGVPGLLFHDLRRSGVRNLIRAGVPETVAMRISGHKTRSVFDRYNITSGRDLKEAVKKLDDYLVTQKGHSSGTIPAPGSKQQKDGKAATDWKC